MVAITLWSAAGPVASVIAPPASAVVLAVSGWRVLFALSAPIALGALVAGWRVLPESRAESVGGRLDAAGVAVGTMAIASLIFAVSQGANLGWASPPVVVAYVGFALATPLFLDRCRRHPEPLLNLDVFLLRPVWTANLANFFLNAPAVGTWLVWPLLFSRVWGYSPLATGFALMPAPLVSALIVVNASRLLERFGAVLVTRVGSIVSVTACVWGAVLVRESADYWLCAAPSIAMMGGGWALTQPPLNSEVMSQVGADLYGQANAAFNTVRNIASAMGIAIAVAVIGEPGRSDVLAAYRRTFIVFAVLASLCFLTLAFLFPRPARNSATAPSR